MGIFDKMNDASKGVSEKAKNMSELGNLKRKIVYEEERIVEIFADIGKAYYKNCAREIPELKELCDDIDVRRRRIKKMKMELYNLRGFKICPNCNAEVNEKFQFCGVCGAKLPSVEEEDFFNDEMDSKSEYFSSNTQLQANPSGLL